MKFRIEKSFDRDAARIKDKKVLRKLKELISTIGNAETIQKVPNNSSTAKISTDIFRKDDSMICLSPFPYSSSPLNR